MEPWIRPNDNPRRGWTRIEKRLVREVWDSTCDEIVRDLADKYAWYAPWYIGDAIVAHLPPDKLEAFKQACEENETHVYYNLLMRYGEWRLAQMKVAVREPRLLKCAGCGREFREWSVHIGFAKKVGHKIRFCNDCYGRAFPFDNYGIEAASMSQDDLLNRLAKLAAALESVPLVTFVRQPDLTSVSEEKQIAIVKALLDMPSYRAYVETH